MSGGSTISTSETRVEALSLQSSAYGVTIPLVYGVSRLAGNMLWYGGFKATPHTTSNESGGKGGGVKTQDTKYTYSASLMMGLCEGQIAGISRAWRGKQVYAGGILPSELLTASEAYAVPSGGGTYTVTHAANFSAQVAVMLHVPADGVDQPAFDYQLAEGEGFTCVAGAYIFAAGSSAAGRNVTVQYQYTSASIPQTALQQLGLSLSAGEIGQQVWPVLTTDFPDQAIGYNGLAFVCAQDYDLGSSASVENHTFEVQGPLAYSIGSDVPDADPATFALDVLTNGRYGAGFPADKIGDAAGWSAYCLAANLLMSPAITEQLQASDFLTQVCKVTNTGVVWSGGRLRFVPYGDTAIAGHGAVYTPNVTPVYDLTDDDFTPGDGGDPVKVMRKPQSDAYNHVRIEFRNRANLYNIEIVEAKDAASIDAYGLRSADVLQLHWVCDAAVAAAVVQLLLQRAVYIRTTYEFALPWTKALLEPMDIVTLTDAGLGFDRVPVRITEISEAEDGGLTVTAEEFPLGVAHAALYASQSGDGFQHNYGVAPGDVSVPLIFEAPIERTLTGLEVYVAVRGAGANWGGCRVWTSLDGVQYKDSGLVYGGARYGVLTSAVAMGGSMAVAIEGGQLISGSATDSANLATLCYVGGANPEYLAYATATLTGARAYTLSGLTRQAFGTNPTGAAHVAGDGFARVDDAIGKSGPLDLEMVGKSIYFKFTSFNIYGAAEQSLADVAAYPYRVAGTMANLPPPPFDVFTVLAQPDGTRQYNFSYAGAAPVDWKGAVIRYVGGTTSAPDWDAMAKLQDVDTYYTNSPVEMNAPLAGPYTFAARSLDQLGNLSTMVVRNITLPDRRLGNVFDEFDEGAEGWSGTMAGCHVLAGILEANDSRTWATLPATWDGWTRWNLNPTSPITYTTPVRSFGTQVAGRANSVIDAEGTVVQEIRTSMDGITWSAWGPLAASFNTFFVQLRVTITATLLSPVPTLRSWYYEINAPLISEYINDVVIASLTGPYRIGVGDVRIPLTGTYAGIKRTNVVVQDNSAGTWTYARIDQVLTGPRWQFRLNGVLADPQFVDFFIEGY